MLSDTYIDSLSQEGFQLFGEIAYRLRFSLWWQQDLMVQVMVFPLGQKALLKGCKDYYLTAVTHRGETWSRDLGPLQNYLESHFPELHISFSHFRDITKSVAGSHIRRSLSKSIPEKWNPAVADFSRLQAQLLAKDTNWRATTRLIATDTGSSSLLQSYLIDKEKTLRKEIESLRERHGQERERSQLIDRLQDEYLRKGSAAFYLFSLSSNVQVVTRTAEFADALKSVVKELTDAHRYQVTQKLLGGKLNIHVEEAEEPALAWVEEWCGGALSPRQLALLNEDFRVLRDASEKTMMVTPKEDIQVDDRIKDSKKLVAARFLSNVLRRLDPADSSRAKLTDLPDEVMPVKVGLIVKEGRTTTDPLTLPLARLENLYISGTTGSGKTYAGRILIEEAARHKRLNILVLDPRNQAVGLLVPEDRAAILQLYREFGIEMGKARGFAFNYYSPGIHCGFDLPRNLSKLGLGRSIVSFKGLTDLERCRGFTEILAAVFRRYSEEESASLQLLILVEEAQLFTKKKVDEEAKKTGEGAERALDRIIREGRKYGLCTIVSSQTIRDFAYDSASIRQNTNTKVFLHNSDREINYAADFIGDGRRLLRLKRGTAIVFNSEWGALEVRFRPPLSKVWEYGEQDTRLLLGAGSRSAITLSVAAQSLINAVKTEWRASKEPLNLSRAADLAGITSKRSLHRAVNELESSGLVRTRKLRQRGQPRIIEPIPAGQPDEILDGNRTEHI